ncbi:IMPACT family protein [Lysobacteraceae bacterium NML91-0213]|nr:IMPACT family protein [Xanthomonadaceae bacterium NML91-0213]
MDTLAAAAEHTLEVKHSRFLARAAPVDSADAAQAWIRTVSVADATHNCWAWRVGGDYRSSDDGEPAGTAGRPILAAIDGQGYDRIAVVVTRWYGGIKLGAGGLVRAYGGAAAECLRVAPREPLVDYAEVIVRAGFEDLGCVHQAIDAHQAVKQDETYGADGVRVVLRLPATEVEALQVLLRDASRDRVRVDVAG